MCIMPKVKKCEKTFALNVDIFIKWLNIKKMFTKRHMLLIMSLGGSKVQ